MRRVAIAIVIVAALVGGFWLFDFVTRPPEKQVRDEPIATRFSQPHFVKYRKGGEREWSLKAEVVEEATDGSGTVNFEAITEGVLFQENKPRFSFVADRGTLTEERDLHLMGHVIFYEDGEAVFESDEVIWQAERETVLAPTLVTANYDGQRLTADRLEARLREDTVTLSGNVLWTTEEGIQVRAGSAVYADDRLEFTGSDGPVKVRLERESSS